MKRRKVIIDTDWFTDCDDVMAVRTLCNLHRCKVFELLGVSLNAAFPDSVRSVDAFLRDNGVDVPVAIVRDFQQEAKAVPTYQMRLAKMPSKYTCNDDAEIPERMYRRLLANTTERVDIISIGFTENLARLLLSEPDDISPLSGMELVTKSVGELWMMAGRWDVEIGHEYNFCGEPETRNAFIHQSAAVICQQWPRPITFLGYEIAMTVISGNELPMDDALKHAMIDFGSGEGRFSWDPMTVLLAAAGSPEAAGYDAVQGRADASPETGENTFTRSETGPHRYVVKKYPDSFYQKRLNQAMEKFAMPIFQKDASAAVLNYGSLNIDTVYTLPHFVQPGETISCSRMERNAGGKGLNQSIALGRAGAKVVHGGCVGADGEFLVKMLKDAGVDTTQVKQGSGASGHAIIEVEEATGDNRIILFPGTNRQLDDASVKAMIDGADVSTGDFFLLQNETSATDFSIREAARQGLNVVYNPAPFDAVAKGVDYNCVKTCIVNEIEASQLTGLTVDSAPEAMADAFTAAYPSTELIITLGANGALFACANTRYRIPAARAEKVVDTTAAGDTFVGYYLAAVLKGYPPKTAMEYAAKASAITVSRPGAAQSIPMACEVF